jgi:hypothetical protein
MSSPRGGPRRVVVHVGAPKSGTTFLQSALWSHRRALLEQGVTCPGRRERDMFLAAVEVREVAARWGFDADDVAGTWRRLCGQARAFDGTTIMSHEILAAATEEQVARALAELDGEEVHIVYTARDLGRQVSSEWQERIKNGSKRTFAGFGHELEKQIAGDDFGGMFWRAHDAAGVLSRWGAGVPADRVHVVVCPPPGAAPEELWHRFGDACGFAADAVDPTSGRARSNKTLGAVEVSVLRRVNQALDGRIPQPQYGRVVKRLFAQKALAQFSSPGPRCPAALLGRLQTLAEQRNEQLRGRGYRIHGDLDDLRPQETGGPALDPDDVDPRRELEVSIAVIAEMLVERADRRAALSGPVQAIPSVVPPRPARRAWRRLRGAVRRGRDGAV